MNKCGMYEIEITPPLGLMIPGYFQKRQASEVVDGLFAKALVLDNGKDTAAIVALDAIGTTKMLVDGIRERVNSFTGIPRECIMVTATHCHTAGPFHDKEYLPWLIKKAADAVIMAYKKRKSAVLSYGTGSIGGLAFNRRYYMKGGKVSTNPSPGDTDILKPEGPVDESLAVLKIQGTDGNPIGIVVNFSCHLDTVGGTGYCADYPGEISTNIKKFLGNSAVCMFITGACGNINHYDINNPETYDNRVYYKKFGRMLAFETMKILNNPDGEVSLKTLGILTQYSEFNLRKPSSDEIRWANELLKEGKEGGYVDKGVNYTEEAYAQRIVSLSQMKQNDISVEIQIVCTEEMAITGWPGEMFVEFGLELKKRSPRVFNMIAELSNGVECGYIPTRGAFANGGYEPRFSDSANLEEDAGKKIVESSLEMINRHK